MVLACSALGIPKVKDRRCAFILANPRCDNKNTDFSGGALIGNVQQEKLFRVVWVRHPDRQRHEALVVGNQCQLQSQQCLPHGQKDQIWVNYIFLNYL
jgi:hypothetical protein